MSILLCFFLMQNKEENLKNWKKELDRSRFSHQTGRRGFESMLIDQKNIVGYADDAEKNSKRISMQSPRQNESAQQTVSQLLKKKANVDSQLTDRYSDYDALIGRSSSVEGSNHARAQAEIAELAEQDVANKYNMPVLVNVGLGRRSSTSPVRRESSYGHGEASKNVAPGRRQSTSPVSRRSSTHGHGEGEPRQNHAAKSHSSSHRNSHGADAVAREGEDVQKHASKNHSSSHHVKNSHGAGAGAHSSAAHGSSVEPKSGGSTPRHRDTHHSSAHGPVVLPADYLDPDYVNAGHKANLRKSYGTRTEDTFKPIDPVKGNPSSYYW